MATKRTTRGAQNVLSSTFEFDITDTMANVSGTEQAFSATSGVFEIINLPQGSQVVGGDITVVTASDDTGTATISIGDSASATRYASAVNLKAAARTALTLTGYQNDTGLNIRATLANATGNAAAGKVVIHVQYVVDGRVNEVQTH